MNKTHGGSRVLPNESKMTPFFTLRLLLCGMSIVFSSIWTIEHLLVFLYYFPGNTAGWHGLQKSSFVLFKDSLESNSWNPAHHYNIDIVRVEAACKYLLYLISAVIHSKPKRDGRIKTPISTRMDRVCVFAFQPTQMIIISPNVSKCFRRFVAQRFFHSCHMSREIAFVWSRAFVNKPSKHCT